MFLQIVTLLLVGIGAVLGRKLLLAQRANAALVSEVTKLRRRLRLGGR